MSNNQNRNTSSSNAKPKAEQQIKEGGNDMEEDSEEYYLRRELSCLSPKKPELKRSPSGAGQHNNPTLSPNTQTNSSSNTKSGVATTKKDVRSGDSLPIIETRKAENELGKSERIKKEEKPNKAEGEEGTVKKHKPHQEKTEESKPARTSARQRAHTTRHRHHQDQKDEVTEKEKRHQEHRSTRTKSQKSEGDNNEADERTKSANKEHRRHHRSHHSTPREHRSSPREHRHHHHRQREAGDNAKPDNDKNPNNAPTTGRRRAHTVCTHDGATSSRQHSHHRHHHHRRASQLVPPQQDSTSGGMVSRESTTTTPTTSAQSFLSKRRATERSSSTPESAEASNTSARRPKANEHGRRGEGQKHERHPSSVSGCEVATVSSATTSSTGSATGSGSTTPLSLSSSSSSRSFSQSSSSSSRSEQREAEKVKKVADGKERQQQCNEENGGEEDADSNLTTCGGSDGSRNYSSSAPTTRTTRGSGSWTHSNLSTHSSDDSSAWSYCESSCHCSECEEQEAMRKKEHIEAMRRWWLNLWLYRLKTYFLFFHYSYILFVALSMSLAMWISENTTGNPVNFIDTTFVAISAVTCCGLSSVDMTPWNTFSSAIWHVTMIFGGVVFTSAVPPLLRLLTLRRLRNDDELQQGEAISEEKKLWVLKKQKYANQLIVTSTISLLTTYMYWFLAQFIGFLVLLGENNVHFAIARSISSFNNSTFSSAQRQSHEVYTLLIFCLLVPAGGALYPVFYRWFLLLCRRAVTVAVKLKNRREARMQMEAAWLAEEEGSVHSHGARKQAMTANNNMDDMNERYLARNQRMSDSDRSDADGGNDGLTRGLLENEIQKFTTANNNYNNNKPSASAALLSAPPSGGNNNARLDYGGYGTTNAVDSDVDFLDRRNSAGRPRFGINASTHTFSNPSSTNETSDGISGQLRDEGDEPMLERQKRRQEEEQQRSQQLGSRDSFNSRGGDYVLTPTERMQMAARANRGGTRTTAATSIFGIDSANDDAVALTITKNKWIRGFDIMLASKTPANYHQFLFKPSETWYLLFAWILIVSCQFWPFMSQQWSGPGKVLAPFDPLQKILVALCQSISTRFAGIILVDLTLLYPAHILLVILGLYIPAQPIPTERHRRKWNAMFKQGLWRLLTSRFMWLFVSICVILFIEEERVTIPKTSRADITTHVLFEVLSAYATSGVSLSIPGTHWSFSGSLTPYSKFIIMCVMFQGRHRGMDLGLDIGLSDMAKQEAEADAAEREAMWDQQQRMGYYEDAEGNLCVDDEEEIDEAATMAEEAGEGGVPAAETEPPSAGVVGISAAALAATSGAGAQDAEDDDDDVGEGKEVIIDEKDGAVYVIQKLRPNAGFDEYLAQKKQQKKQQQQQQQQQEPPQLVPAAAAAGADTQLQQQQSPEQQPSKFPDLIPLEASIVVTSDQQQQGEPQSRSQLQEQLSSATLGRQQLALLQHQLQQPTPASSSSLAVAVGGGAAAPAATAGDVNTPTATATATATAMPKPEEGLRQRTSTLMGLKRALLGKKQQESQQPQQVASPSSQRSPVAGGAARTGVTRTSASSSHYQQHQLSSTGAARTGVTRTSSSSQYQQHQLSSTAAIPFRRGASVAENLSDEEVDLFPGSPVFMNRPRGATSRPNVGGGGTTAIPMSRTGTMFGDNTVLSTEMMIGSPTGADPFAPLQQQHHPLSRRTASSRAPAAAGVAGRTTVVVARRPGVGSQSIIHTSSIIHRPTQSNSENVVDYDRDFGEYVDGPRHSRGGGVHRTASGGFLPRASSRPEQRD